MVAVRAGAGPWILFEEWLRASIPPRGGMRYLGDISSRDDPEGDSDEGELAVEAGSTLTCKETGVDEVPLEVPCGRVLVVWTSILSTRVRN